MNFSIITLTGWPFLFGSFTVVNTTTPITKPGTAATQNAHLQFKYSTIKLKTKARLYPEYKPRL